MRLKMFVASLLFWCCDIFAIYACYKKSIPVIQLKRRDKLIAIGIVLVVILCCTLPMSLSPFWAGEGPDYRNQYEVMAESILEGHVDLNYGDTDPKLLEMENPYDIEMRDALGISYHWDHAFYDGHYYMYFGIVPVILLFLPFRVITGTSLTTYHASQIFTAFFIVGLFLLFLQWAKKWFPKLSFGLYLALATAFSAMSVWYIVAAPTLYCTAICSALCMEVWSLYFFSKAVWDSANDHQSLIFGVLGGVFGALAFGCRPTVALVNLLAIPMFFCYIKGRKWNARLIGQFVSFLMPYIIIGALLMIYNYVRFDNPFEFGQSYQLTYADQSGYGNVLSRIDPIQIIDGLIENFMGYTSLTETFPYVSFSSVLINFPICIVAYCCLFHRHVRCALKAAHLHIFVAVLFGLPYIITIAEIMMSPWLLERYRSDIYWLMGLLAFIAFGFFYQHVEECSQKKYQLIFILFANVTVFQSFFLWMVPYDGNFTSVLPKWLEQFKAFLSFDLG